MFAIRSPYFMEFKTMPNDKTRNALAVGGALALGLTFVSLGSDVACHMHSPVCDYSSLGVRITATTSTAVVPQTPAVVTMSS